MGLRARVVLVVVLLVVVGGAIGHGMGLGLGGVRGMLMILIRMMGFLRLVMGKVREWILMRAQGLVDVQGTVGRRGCLGGSLEMS
jgi:hypothetical protein